jgi:hypothetical protein
MGLPSSFSGNSVYGVCLAQEDGQWIYLAIRARSEMKVLEAEARLTK